MKAKFKLEVYDTDGTCKSIVNGTADTIDIDSAMDYLLQLKEERYKNELRNTFSDS